MLFWGVMILETEYLSSFIMFLRGEDLDCYEEISSQVTSFQIIEERGPSSFYLHR